MLIGITATLRNGPMIRYRMQEGISQAEAARRAKVAPTAWNALELMRFCRGALTTGQKVSELIGCLIEDIYPHELRKQDCGVTRVAYKRVDPARILESSNPTRFILDDPSKLAAKADEFSHAVGAMACLTHRERGIVKLRHGLDGVGPLTWTEAAKAFRITRERARQVYEGALRKLRKYLNAEQTNTGE